MALKPLATAADVRELFPASFDPGMTDDQINRLIVKASALLRQRARWIDNRIGRFEINPEDSGGLDPVLVASVVASIVKRYIVNPSGATNTTESIGPYSQSVGYALRGEKDARGELVIIDSDLEKLKVFSPKASVMGSLRIRPGLAPGSDRTLAAYTATDTGLPSSGWIVPPEG